eukprot:5163871-Amphidinium_carterae.2
MPDAGVRVQAKLPPFRISRVSVQIQSSSKATCCRSLLFRLQAKAERNSTKDCTSREAPAFTLPWCRRHHAKLVRGCVRTMDVVEAVAKTRHFYCSTS